MQSLTSPHSFCCQTAGQFQPGLLAGHAVPGGRPPRLPGGRLPLSQVRAETGHHDGRCSSLSHLVHHSRGPLHTDHLRCQVSQPLSLSSTTLSFRFISALAIGSTHPSIGVFVSEISHPDWRGSLGVTPSIFLAVGITKVPWAPC